MDLTVSARGRFGLQRGGTDVLAKALAAGFTPEWEGAAWPLRSLLMAQLSGKRRSRPDVATGGPGLR